jgi:hypothetical protein
MVAVQRVDSGSERQAQRDLASWFPMVTQVDLGPADGTVMTVPKPYTTVTLTTSDGSTMRARVERFEDGLLIVRISATAPPAAAGDAVTLRWPAGTRGRYTVGGTVRETTGAWLGVAVSGEPTIEQVRRFVRGGGGEKVWMRPTDSTESVGGHVHDLGEQGLMAQIDGRKVQPGQNVVLLIELDDDTIEVAATVLASRADDVINVVFTFQPEEPQARAIRRHVLRRQSLARKRAADS